MMPTLLLSSRGTLDSIKLRHAAIALGWSVERLLEVEQISRLKEQTQLVIFGEAIFAQLVAKSLGIHLLQPPLNWLAQLRPTYLQRRLIYTTLNQARLHIASAFIKPAGEKSFPARIYVSGNQLPVVPNIPETTPVFIAEPVTWQVEFRCFVLERKPVAVSIYKRNGQLARDANGNWPVSETELGEAQAFCLEVASDARVESPPLMCWMLG